MNNSDFSSKLKYFIDNIKTLPYGDIISFSKSLKTDMIKEEQKLLKQKEQIETQLEINKLNYLKFGELFVNPNATKPKTEQQVYTVKQIGGVDVKFPLIKSINDTKKYNNIPCVISDVHNWFFIYFSELNQTLPVKNYIQILTPQVDTNTCTRMHYGLFKNIPIEELGDSFAVIPFNSETWSKFKNIPYAKWENYLNQLNILPLNITNKYSQKIPIYTTVGLYEIANTLKPEDMVVQWSLFVQLYMLLYIFKQCAGKEHFCF